jgi:hypothetical protein
MDFKTKALELENVGGIQIHFDAQHYISVPQVNRINLLSGERHLLGEK